jgi:hypothetical protein
MVTTVTSAVNRGLGMCIRQKALTFIAVIFALALAASNAKAVVYQYISLPLTADYGTTLGGHPIIFDFSTYNVLPDNMSFGSPSIPVVGWSIIVGQYQASGV